MKKLILLIAVLYLSSIAFAATMEEDVASYAQTFAEEKDIYPATLESMAWKGLSDPRIFDLVEQHLIARAEEGLNDRHVKNEVALYIRALGYSGQAKYIPTLERYRDETTYNGYVRDALADLPRYQRWNPIISNRANFDPRYSDDVNRIRNMLLADDFDLKKIGAKRVYYQNKDDVLLELLAEQIRASYMSNDERNGDSIAWMVKALGSARQEKYLPLIQEVAANAPDSTIVRHARKALKM